MWYTALFPLVFSHDIGKNHEQKNWQSMEKDGDAHGGVQDMSEKAGFKAMRLNMSYDSRQPMNKTPDFMLGRPKRGQAKKNKTKHSAK